MVNEEKSDLCIFYHMWFLCCSKYALIYFAYIQKIKQVKRLIFGMGLGGFGLGRRLERVTPGAHHTYYLNNTRSIHHHLEKHPDSNDH